MEAMRGGRGEVSSLETFLVAGRVPFACFDELLGDVATSSTFLSRARATCPPPAGSVSGAVARSAASLSNSLARRATTARQPAVLSSVRIRIGRSALILEICFLILQVVFDAPRVRTRDQCAAALVGKGIVGLGGVLWLCARARASFFLFCPRRDGSAPVSPSLSSSPPRLLVVVRRCGRWRLPDLQSTVGRQSAAAGFESPSPSTGPRLFCAACSGVSRAFGPASSVAVRGPRAPSRHRSRLIVGYRVRRSWQRRVARRVLGRVLLVCADEARSRRAFSSVCLRLIVLLAAWSRRSLVCFAFSRSCSRAA